MIGGIVLRLNLRLSAVNVVIVDIHVEAARTLRQRLTNFAKAVNSQRLVIEALPDKLQRLPAGPAALPDHGLALAGATRGSQQQQHGNLGSRDRHAVWRVADLNSPLLAGFQIDVIKADGKSRDALDVLRDPLDDVGSALFVEREQKRIDRLGRFQHFINRNLRVIAVRDDIVRRPGALHDGIGKGPGNQNFLL